MTKPTPEEIIRRHLDIAAQQEWPYEARMIADLTAAGYGIADLSTHVIVPKEPTEEQQEAGGKALPFGFYPGSNKAAMNAIIPNIYRAMTTKDTGS